ncbi:MAG: hypothetical protein HN509_00340, partial [Halobacteriovoraceae bacterium]|nr:hypothetical protein [Halobacteriovoraceae bacterium]
DPIFFIFIARDFGYFDGAESDINSDDATATYAEGIFNPAHYIGNCITGQRLPLGTLFQA